MEKKPDSSKKRKRTWRVLTGMCAAVLVVSVFQLFTTLYRSGKEDRAFKELARYTEVPVAEPVREESQKPKDGGKDWEETLEDARRSNYLRLKEMNGDFAGWLYIHGTKVDYPVMYTPEDEQYYIHRDFYGEDSVSGTPFIGAGGGLSSQSMIIYGHNMKNDTMFGSLDLYDSKAYWEEHPVIEFHTVEEDREYEIAAVFRTRIYGDDEKGFRYYQYVGDLTEEEFEEFKTQVITQASYDTGISLEPGDEILMLSTCAYHARDGRLVVVARRRS